MEPKDEIDMLREEIDNLDSKLIDILRARLALAAQIGRIKKASKISIHDPAREKSKIDAISNLANKKNISPAFMEDIMRCVFSESRRIQQEQEQ